MAFIIKYSQLNPFIPIYTVIKFFECTPSKKHGLQNENFNKLLYLLSVYLIKYSER